MRPARLLLVLALTWLGACAAPASRQLPPAPPLPTSPPAPTPPAAPVPAPETRFTPAEQGPGPSSTCGDGRIGVRTYERVCASCIPGRACPCGWAPSSVEECDGANLGGKDCESLGFVGGQLRCTASCTFDTSGCARTARGVQTLSVPAPRGGANALFLDGSRLGVVSSEGSNLSFDLYDAAGLAPAGVSARWMTPVIYPPNEIGLERAMHARRDTLGPVSGGPLGQGYLLAAYQYGDVQGTVTLLAQGRALTGPASTLTRFEPLFVASAAGATLIGLDRGGLEVGPVSPDGSVPTPRAIGPERRFGNAAVAAFDGAGWRIAGIAKASNDPEARLLLARLSPSGALQGSGLVELRPESVAIAASAAHTWVVVASRMSLDAFEVSGCCAAGKIEHLAGSGHRVLAARLTGQGLEVFATGPTGALLRLHLGADGTRDSTPLLALPGLEVRAAIAGPQGFYAVYTAGTQTQRTAPMLFLVR
jgi:prepilin-type processing-associated H-X9-DG protein